MTPAELQEYRLAARTVHRWLARQVRKPYVFGSQGPDSWDCSALLSAAWRRVGVHLTPYTGTMVDELDVIPNLPTTWLKGTLLFYYSDHHHVSQYVERDWRGRRIVIAATDEAHGVERVPYDRYLLPSAARMVRRPVGGYKNVEMT